MYRVAIVACLILAGCQQRVDQAERVFEQDDGEFVLTIVLDMSSSFEPLMAEDGKAWGFVCEVIEKYFRDRIGHNDKLILAQLSNSDRALLWEGTPLELRQEFPTAAAFRAWVASKADPYGSRLYEGIVQAVEYSDPGNRKSAVIVLSDLIDTAGNEQKDEAVSALATVGKSGGVGLYFVDVQRCSEWKQLLQDAGVPPENVVVEADIVGRPMLPRFE